MPPFAACCSSNLFFASRIDRRYVLRSLGTVGITASLPLSVLASEGKYDAMLLSCIDPRMVGPVYKYMQGLGLEDKYSQFCITGAAIAAVAPKFKAWRPAFWDNIKTSYQLHHIDKIIAINHRDCGGAKIAYGEQSVASPQAETAIHKRVLAEFREQVAERHPKLVVVTGLMALDGSIEIFS